MTDCLQRARPQPEVYLGRGVFSPVSTISFLASLSLLSPTSNLAKRFLGVLLASGGWREHLQHGTRPVGSKYTKNAFADYARLQTHFVVQVYGGCICRRISLKLNLKIEANVVVYRMYCMFMLPCSLHFIWGGV